MQPRVCRFCEGGSLGKKVFNTWQSSEKRETPCKQVLLVPSKCRMYRSYFTPLCQDGGVIEVAFLPLEPGLSFCFPSIRQVLDEWKGSFVGKKRKEVWRAAPLCLAGTVWKQRYMIVFDDVDLFIQKLKNSFFYLLWSEVKLHIKEAPPSLVRVINLLGSRWYLALLVGRFLSWLEGAGTVLSFFDVDCLVVCLGWIGIPFLVFMSWFCEGSPWVANLASLSVFMIILLLIEKLFIHSYYFI